MKPTGKSPAVVSPPVRCVCQASLCTFYLWGGICRFLSQWLQIRSGGQPAKGIFLWSFAVTAAYLAGSDLEESQGTLQTKTPEFIAISTKGGQHWIARQHLVSLLFPAEDKGSSPYPATRLHLFPQNPRTDNVFSFIAIGKVADSPRFLYVLEPVHSGEYKLTLWAWMPVLFGRSYETSLTVQEANGIAWPAGRVQVPAGMPFQVQLKAFTLPGRVAYVFSLPPEPPAEDSSLMTCTAKRYLLLSPVGDGGLGEGAGKTTESRGSMTFPEGEGHFYTGDGPVIPFQIQAGRPIRIPYPSTAPLQATLQERIRKAGRKAPLTITGTVRITNPYAETLHLLVEKPLIWRASPHRKRPRPHRKARRYVPPLLGSHLDPRPNAHPIVRLPPQPP